jgi:hypothetical protein
MLFLLFSSHLFILILNPSFQGFKWSPWFSRVLFILGSLGCTLAVTLHPYRHPCQRDLLNSWDARPSALTDLRLPIGPSQFS